MNTQKKKYKKKEKPKDRTVGLSDCRAIELSDYRSDSLKTLKTTEEIGFPPALHQYLKGKNLNNWSHL
jgi:hypothetical protein